MIQQKLVNEISLNFPELVIIAKYVKTRFKTGGHHAIFSVSEINRSKILEKLNKRDCFGLHSWLHFLWRFSRKVALALRQLKPIHKKGP